MTQEKACLLLQLLNERDILEASSWKPHHRFLVCVPFAEQPLILESIQRVRRPSPFFFFFFRRADSSKRPSEPFQSCVERGKRRHTSLKEGAGQCHRSSVGHVQEAKATKKYIYNKECMDETSNKSLSTRFKRRLVYINKVARLYF